MGLLTELIRPRNAAPPFAPLVTGAIFGTGTQAEYMRFARSYMTNEIVFACIDLLADSAGEPQLIGKRYRRESPRMMNRLEMRAHAKNLVGRGLSHREADERMVKNGFYEAVPNHPLVKLCNNPNPMASRGQFWGTMVQDRYIAGNAYALKSRFQSGPLNGKVAELWRMRPDRVKIIPGSGGIEGYEYNTGRDKIVYPAADVLHFKERHPLNDYYGMPPMSALFDRLSIEEYMRGFLRSFFETGGVGPGAVLSVKQKMSQAQKDEIRTRYERQFGSATGFKSLMILDQAEHAYTQLGLNRGLRDALPAEIDASLEARIAMVFRIPGSIIGLRIGYESSSYANKRQDWQVFWDLTMTPLLSDMDDTLNLGLVAEFGGIDDICFDLGDIRALQEDVDKLHDRHRKNWLAGLETWEEAREGIAFDPEITEGTLALPGNMTPFSVRRLEETAEEEPEPPAPPQLPEPVVDVIKGNYDCPKCGRWVGRDLIVGSTVYCPRDKEVLVERGGKVISIDIVRDDDGRVMQLVGAGE